MKPYQKTAKDLAFDKERAKLRRQICNLQEALRAAEGKAAAGTRRTCRPSSPRTTTQTP